MTGDALAVVQFVFTTVWSLTTSWHIPGTNVTPLGVSLLVLSSVSIIRLAKKYLFGGNN